MKNNSKIKENTVLNLSNNFTSKVLTLPGPASFIYPVNWFKSTSFLWFFSLLTLSISFLFYFFGLQPLAVNNIYKKAFSRLESYQNTFAKQNANLKSFIDQTISFTQINQVKCGINFAENNNQNNNLIEYQKALNQLLGTNFKMENGLGDNVRIYSGPGFYNSNVQNSLSKISRGYKDGINELSDKTLALKNSSDWFIIQKSLSNLCSNNNLKSALGKECLIISKSISNIDSNSNEKNTEFKEIISYFKGSDFVCSNENTNLENGEIFDKITESVRFAENKKINYNNLIGEIETGKKNFEIILSEQSDKMISDFEFKNKIENKLYFINLDSSKILN